MKCKPIPSLFAVLILLASSSGLSSPDSPKKKDDIDLKDLVRRAAAKLQARKSLSLNYTYLAHCVYFRFDTRIKYTTPNNADYEIMFIEGEQYMHQLKQDGLPLSPEQERRDTALREAFAKERREGTLKRGELLPTYTFLELPFERLADEFTLHAKGKQPMDGREVQVIDAFPRDTGEASGDDQETARHFKFKLWVDTSEAQVVKVQATVIKDIAWTRILTIIAPNADNRPAVAQQMRTLYKRGTIVTVEWTKLPDGAWLPKHCYVKAPQRIWTNVSHQRSSQPWLDVLDWTYSDYKRFRVDTRIVPQS